MKILTLINLSFLLLISCQQPSDTKEIQKTDAKVDTLLSKSEVKDGTPSLEFIRLAKFIDSSGYYLDTLVPFQKNNLENLIFYKMKFEETPLYIHRDPSANVKGADYCALNIDLFKNCKNIWGYSFLKKGEVKNDRLAHSIGGFIEEFDLPDPSSTAAALKEIDRKKSLVFYRTRSFCCSLGNSVYIFNIAQGGFDAALKAFFDEFLKNNGITIPHNIPCYEE